MTRRGRITAFGGAGVLVAAGIICAVLVGGVLGAVLAFVLIGVGLVLATSLTFLEVGLSEDRAREREHAAMQRQQGRERARFTRLRSHRRGLS